MAASLLRAARSQFDDSAAINAITVLRSGHEWNEIANLDFHIGYESGIHNFKNFLLRADEQYRA